MGSSKATREPDAPDAVEGLRWKRVSLFAASSVALFALLMASFSLVEDAHRAWLEASSEFVLQLFTSTYEIELVDDPTAASTDVALVVQAREGAAARERVIAGISSRWAGYAPFAIFAALMLSTPLAWRSRLRKLVRGLLCLEAFLIVRLGLLPFESFANHFPLCPHPEVHASPWTESSLLPKLLSGMSSVIAEIMIFYAVPLALWLVFLVRDGSWKRFFEMKPHAS